VLGSVLKNCPPAQPLINRLDIPGARVGRVIMGDVDLLDDEAGGQVARQIAAPQDYIPSTFAREACHAAQANLAAIRLREHTLSSGENGRKYVVIVWGGDVHLGCSLHHLSVRGGNLTEWVTGAPRSGASRVPVCYTATQSSSEPQLTFLAHADGR